MQRRIPNSPFDAHVAELKHLFEVEGVVEGADLAERMGISQERIQGLAVHAKIEVKNLELKPVRRGRKKPAPRFPDLEALMRIEQESHRKER